jgi:copper transporter 1
MLFTWDTTNLCIVFRQWHVRSTASLIFSLLAVVLIGIGYEAIRAFSRRYELATSKRVESLPSKHQTPLPLPLIRFFIPGRSQELGRELEDSSQAPRLFPSFLLHLQVLGPC